jgi:putative Ca2+/H+ antiporter (TMEM165/GDT1 family)
MHRIASHPVVAAYVIPAVTLSGSILFILFGIIYLYEAFSAIDIDVHSIPYYN